MPKVKGKLKLFTILGKKEMEFELEGTKEEILELGKRFIDGMSI